MAMTLHDKFQHNWALHFQALQPATYLLAVSGGVDSMVLCELFLKSQISFAVAHCNFQLRGAEADLDEQLVRNWCLKHGISVHVTRFDTAETATAWKKGIQETARILRYEWFENRRIEHKYAAIITAHHANDNVETMLMNLFRGTGIAGIHGILPKNGYILRPLLFAQKDELIAYANNCNIPFRNDASNDNDDYLRNAVRRNIMPVVNAWFPGAVSHIHDSIGRFAEAEMLYDKAIANERKKLIEKRGNDYYIPILKLRHRLPLQTIVYELLSPFGFSSAQISHALQLLTAESGHFITSSTHRLIRNRDFLIITTLSATTTDIVLIETAPCQIDSVQHRYSFTIVDKVEVFNLSRDIAYLDYNELVFPLILRKWRTGDYFYPFGMDMKKKKVSRVLINEKTPLHEKETIMVLESNKRIAWLSGIRVDERFRIKKTTNKVLVVKRGAL